MLSGHWPFLCLSLSVCISVCTYALVFPTDFPADFLFLWFIEFWSIKWAVIWAIKIDLISSAYENYQHELFLAHYSIKILYYWTTDAKLFNFHWQLMWQTKTLCLWKWTELFLSTLLSFSLSPPHGMNNNVEIKLKLKSTKHSFPLWHFVLIETFFFDLKVSRLKYKSSYLLAVAISFFLSYSIVLSHSFSLPPSLPSDKHHKR